ncbi:unnamed protein product [Gongylonema pulchrum]|uniref:Secreted protein n=1 Tax=Gongylonema pulchrum TaxID=637853 RepID=A0A183CYA7_9BILA|nr:unnamed protein product [Gongylonema pulchrum]
MNLMTFSTFLFISLEGLIFTSKFFSVKNKIPVNLSTPGYRYLLVLCNIATCKCFSALVVKCKLILVTGFECFRSNEILLAKGSRTAVVCSV